MTISGNTSGASCGQPSACLTSRNRAPKLATSATRPGFAAVCCLLLLLCAATETAAEEEAQLEPLVRVVDIDQGQPQKVTLHDGTEATVELLGMRVERDSVMGAIRQVEVDVAVNGETATLVSGLYRLPVSVGGVQIDCPVTEHYNADSHIDHWALEAQCRLRLWPADSDWIGRGTFVYPLDQAWFASQTWFSNEAVSRRPDGRFYYHAGLDLGGTEFLVSVLAATDGRVVSVAGHSEENLPADAVSPRYDVVYLRDDRGWYYRYSHLSSIGTPVRLGARVKAGQPIGAIGKEGASGGWTHLHFEIKSRQPSGRWGTQDSYVFLWQANRQQRDPDIIAVARPRHLALTGETVTLDGTRSWSRGQIAKYEWTFGDGTRATGRTVERSYDRPGMYNEILTVTDDAGRTGVDFAVVKVVDLEHPDQLPPGLHATFHPSLSISPGDPVTFTVRARNTAEGRDTWDFGDGSELVVVRSNIDPEAHAQIGYASTVHRFEKPGRYIVSVRRSTAQGDAVDRLLVEVGPR